MIRRLADWCVPDDALRWGRLTRGSLTGAEACLRIGCPPGPICGLTGRMRAPAENQAAAKAWSRRQATDVLSVDCDLCGQDVPAPEPDRHAADG